MALSSYRWTYWATCYSVTMHIIKLQVCSSLLWLQEAIGWFIHLNCCHGSQRWRRALLLWEHLSKRAFGVCWGEKTLRYVCLALFLYISVCVHACLTVWCPRAAMMCASVWETPPGFPLLLCARFFGARHSSHILCWLTTPPLPWLLAKLFPRWPPDALELLGSKQCISHPSPDTVFRKSASPPSMLERQRQTYKDRKEGRRAQRPFEHYCMHD